MSPEKTKELAEKYPKIFKHLGGDPRETCMAWGICTGDGWYEILDELCAKLEPHGVIAAQIKEKFGTLRFYLEATPSDKWNEIHSAITEAEIKSSLTCEICGEPGKIRGGGWVRCLCDNCCNKDE